MKRSELIAKIHTEIVERYSVPKAAVGEIVDAVLAAGERRWRCETGPIELPDAEIVEGCRAEDCPVCEGGQIFQQHTGPISWWVCPVCERPTHATACGWVVVLDVDTEDN